MTRAETLREYDLSDFILHQKIEKSLADKLGLPDLHSGIQLIRNENGLRENKKHIESTCIVIVSRSFVGWGGIFSIQFRENNYREYLNPNELIQGIFTYDNEGVKDLYTETLPNASDKILEKVKSNLFDLGQEIGFHRVSYEFNIITSNIKAKIKFNNLPDWKEWETEIFDLGKKLSVESNIPELIHLFTFPIT